MIHNFRNVVPAILMALGLVMPLVEDASAQTRLGLHVTQEELNIWKQRAQSGPYKTAGDASANSPSDWTRILANGNALLSSPTSDRWDGTGLSTTGACKTQPNQPGPASDRSLGDRTRDAAFVYLLTGTSSYLTVAKNNLLYEAGRPDLNFGNSSIWCIGPVWDTNPFFDLAHWLVKLVFAYDYIRPSLVSGPNQDTSAVSTLDTWFLNMGVYWEAVVDQQTNFNYANSRQNNLTDFSLSSLGSSNANTLGVRTYCGGPFDNSLSGKYQNRMASFVKLFTQIGVMLNQSGVSTTTTARLKTMGKRYFMEYLQFAIMPDGTPLEFERNISDGIPNGAQHGWRYSTDTAASLAMLADALARTGDTSLYDYTTSNGAGSGANSTAGGSKSLGLVHLQLARYVNQTQTGAPRYAKDSTTTCSSGGSDTLIGPQLNTSNGEASNRDTFLVQANLYYRSVTGANNVQSEYLRTASGAAAYPSSPETGGYCAYCGPSGEFPGVLFMFGQMEGTVWPYPTGSQVPAEAPASPTGLTVRID